MYIEWKEAYCIGVPDIDDQHRLLIDQLNALYEKIGPDTGPGDIWNLLAVFNRYAETHFASEERVAALHNVAQHVLTAHKAEHDSYRQRMIMFRQAFERNDRHAPVQLMAFLSRWWLTHILIEDMELGRLIRAQEPLAHG